jgi:hypothetical protein
MPIGPLLANASSGSHVLMKAKPHVAQTGPVRGPYEARTGPVRGPLGKCDIPVFQKKKRFTTLNSFSLCMRQCAFSQWASYGPRTGHVRAPYGPRTGPVWVRNPPICSQHDVPLMGAIGTRIVIGGVRVGLWREIWFCISTRLWADPHPPHYIALPLDCSCFPPKADMPTVDRK